MAREEKSGKVHPKGTQYQYPEDGYLNYSQLAEWLKCRYRWELSRVRHISSRRTQRALDIGSAVHYGIAAGLKLHASTVSRVPGHLKKVQRVAKKAVLQWIEETVATRGGVRVFNAEENDELQEILDNAPGIASRSLFQMDLEQWAPVMYRGKPMIEQSLQIPLPTWAGWKGFHMTPDFVATNREDGQTWILDYKVRKQFTSPEAEEVNMQFAVYQRGLASVGIDTVGSIMFQAASKIPATPTQNKDGSMSRARIATTWEKYRETLEECGLDPEDYAEMEAKLDVVFFRETREPRTVRIVEAMWNNFLLAAFSMSKTTGTAGEPRTGMFSGIITCNGCWARRFCLAELAGDDTEFLLETDYIDTVNPKERLVLRPEDVEFLNT